MITYGWMISYFQVSAVYLKEIGNYAGYYREALRYLGCEDQSKLSQSEKQMQAVLLGFAALLGENIYNFGELVSLNIFIICFFFISEII